MQPVQSSLVSEIGYDPATQELTVAWQEGRVSVYSSVPQNVASDVMNAPSVGRAMQAVKKTYQHRYVS